MRVPLAGLVLLLAMSRPGVAQPADCPVEPSPGAMLPLSLDLAGRPGVPANTTGQAYIAVPMQAPGIACRDGQPPPMDALRGEPGDVLGPRIRDLLRGPGTPHVEVEGR